ncbi:MAG: hypothetical protein FWD53_12450, partial [Phycisphaerales bacterium]|nr:hypothetical protein [Phycisphaerales bacterium]
VDLADLTILARNWKKTIGDVAVMDTDSLSWAEALASVTFGTPSSSAPKPAAAVVAKVLTASLSGPVVLNWEAPRFNNTFNHEFRATGIQATTKNPFR